MMDEYDYLQTYLIMKKAALKAFLFLLISGLLVAFGCGDPKIQTRAVTGVISTYNHDGHLFVTFRDCIIHHPECPALNHNCK